MNIRDTTGINPIEETVFAVDEKSLLSTDFCVGKVAKERFSLFFQAGKFLVLSAIIVLAVGFLAVPVTIITAIFACCWGVGRVVRALSPAFLGEKIKCIEDLFHSLTKETLSCLLMYATSSINMEWVEPKGPKEGTPHLFVHGFLGSSSNWFWMWANRPSKASDANDYFVNFGHPFQGIRDDYIETMHNKILYVCKTSGKFPEFTCHSMGGRVAVEWWLWVHKNNKLNAIAEALGESAPPQSILIQTLGTPFDGTGFCIARMVSYVSPAVNEMLPENSTYAALVEIYGKEVISEALNKVSLRCHIAANDRVVRPPHSALARGLRDQAGHQLFRDIREYEHKTWNHVGLMFSAKVIEACSILD